MTERFHIMNMNKKTYYKKIVFEDLLFSLSPIIYITDFLVVFQLLLSSFFSSKTFPQLLQIIWSPLVIIIAEPTFACFHYPKSFVIFNNLLCSKHCAFPSLSYTQTRPFCVASCKSIYSHNPLCLL